jgi:hypothetical protein
VFPHEVVGFSGGNKYLFPGVSGPRILNFFHWLGAVVTNPMIIGNKWTPVRRVVDRAARWSRFPSSASAWWRKETRPGRPLRGDARSGLGRGQRAFAPVAHHLQRASVQDDPLLRAAMYDELWTGGKCMYKLEPVLADGGELIIYAPHISEVCVTTARLCWRSATIAAIIFSNSGTVSNIIRGACWRTARTSMGWALMRTASKRRARASLWPRPFRRMFAGKSISATAIPKASAKKTSPTRGGGIVARPQAGEMLYHLKNPPPWAGGVDPVPR